MAGKAALIRQHAAWPQNSGKARFADGIRDCPTEHREVVSAEFHGVSEIVPTGRSQDQRYDGILHLQNGKVALFGEHFDANVFA